MDLNVRIGRSFATKYTDPKEFDTYIEGREGSEYTITVTNSRPNRYLCVVSVDGLNVISGDKDWSKGYIADRYTTIEIDGWRISETQIAKFVFGKVRDSYASSSNNGSIDNCGVIGVKLFREKYSDFSQQQLWNAQPHSVFSSSVRKDRGSTSNIDRRVTMSSMVNQSMSTASISQSIGTEFGNIKNSFSEISGLQFESYAEREIIVYYDDARGLEKRGIKVKRSFYKPNAFPSFCIPPR